MGISRFVYKKAFAAGNNQSCYQRASDLPWLAGWHGIIILFWSPSPILFFLLLLCNKYRNNNAKSSTALKWLLSCCWSVCFVGMYLSIYFATHLSCESNKNMNCVSAEQNREKAAKKGENRKIQLDSIATRVWVTFCESTQDSSLSLLLWLLVSRAVVFILQLVEVY